MSTCKTKYRIIIGNGFLTGQLDKEIDIDNPSDQEVLNSPYYKGDMEHTRLYLVKCKADKIMDNFCKYMTFELDNVVNYEIDCIEFVEDGVRKYMCYSTPVIMKTCVKISDNEIDLASIEKNVAYFDKPNSDLNLYIKSITANVFERYKLLYLIASEQAKDDITLRTIRNMLHHKELDCNQHPAQCKKAEQLFGPGVRSIDYTNPSHSQIIENHILRLKKMAKSIVYAQLSSQ